MTARNNHQSNSELILKGIQVNMNERSEAKTYKNSCNKIISSRPFSAGTGRQTHNKDKFLVLELKRPLSADAIFCSEKSFDSTEFQTMDSGDYSDNSLSKENPLDIANLPSTKLFKSLLSESLEHNMNNESNSLNKISSSLSNTNSEKSLKTKIREYTETPLFDVGIQPGIRMKPPVPSREWRKFNTGRSLDVIYSEQLSEVPEENDLYEENENDDDTDNDNEVEEDTVYDENEIVDQNYIENENGDEIENVDENNDECKAENIEENDKFVPYVDIGIEFSDSEFENPELNAAFKIWLQENKNMLLESKLFEIETDIELQNVHEQQDQLSENFKNEHSMINDMNKKLTEKGPNDPPILEKFVPLDFSSRDNFNYRTETSKKNQTKTTTRKPDIVPKKSQKNILKPSYGKKPQNAEKEKRAVGIEDETSWMATNQTQDPFLDYLDQINDTENDTPEIIKVPTSPKSYSHYISVDQCELKDASTTSDEISSLLEVLEKEDLRSQRHIQSLKDIVNSELPNSKGKQTSQLNNDAQYSSSTSLASSTNYTDFLTYLDEIDSNCMETLKTAQERVKNVVKVTKSVISTDTIPRLKDLLEWSTVELSHYIIDISLQLKEKTSCIATLQEELKKLRNLFNSKTEEYETTIKGKIQQQKDDLEAIIKRHQKFIDQLIADKKTLNHQCEGLINEMKVLEDRYNSNMKAIEQRHKIELQKAKEMHMAAEKLRREKWIEGKTQKIKEMTVKGLEPELQNMAARHQQELSDLRTIHKREIEELELRAARKTHEQCEIIRNQLTAEREAAVAHERDVLRLRLEKLVETEEKSYQEQKRRLNADHAARLSECEDRIIAMSNEKERAIEAAKLEFEDKLKTAHRRHKTEMKNLRESVDLEFQLWKNNYKKQQHIKLAEAEAQMKEACKNERDREIELVIERLEVEANETKAQIEQAFENRLRRIKEKYEAEIKDLENLINDYKMKYSETKDKLVSSEDDLINLTVSMKQIQTQLMQAKQLTEELSQDKDKMKEQIKEEFVTEMKSLEEEVKMLRTSRDEEMQRIFNKVKLTVSHKDELLTELTKSNAHLQEKCTLLENLLEQQRKEYLTK